MAVDTLQVWKELSEERRIQAATAFFADKTLSDFHAAAYGFIARVKNFRPQFVKKLPLDKRAGYLAHLPLTPDLASQLLVSYHFAHHRPMMKAFLDALAIPNDDGLIKEDFKLKRIAEPQATAAAQTISADFASEDVRIYLATLAAQNPEIWDALARVLPASPKAVPA